MIKNILKGFIIGIGKIIPGVSGSMLAISMGVYERALKIISKFGKAKFGDYVFIISLAIGVFLGICLFSKGVKWLLDSYYLTTMLLFIGLILSGFPDVIKKCKISNLKKNVKIKYIILFVLSFIFSYLLTKLEIGGISSNSSDVEVILSFKNVFIFFIIGLLEAFSSIVPGISGTAIFMSIGCYYMLLSFYENILNPTYWGFGIVFFAGVIVGIIILSKVITYMLERYKTLTYIVILGFVSASLFVMVFITFSGKGYFSDNLWNSFLTIFKSLIYILIGYYLGSKINRILSND